MNKKLISLTSVILLWLAVRESAQALPSFSRKYGTGCVTCHEAFPRRNAVGEAFRLRGYRFVDDEAYVKVPPVELGDEAYNRLWPHALWSSDIPASFPWSAVTRFILEADMDGSRDAEVLFLFPEEIELVWAGVLGKTFSFYGDVRFIQMDFEGGDIDSWAQLKARLTMNDIIGPPDLINLNVGSVGMNSLGLWPCMPENNLTTHYYQYASWLMPEVNLEQSGLAEFQGNPFECQPQVGVELFGFGSRWKYALGVVSGDVTNPNGVRPEDDIFFEGSGRNRGSKDGYVQLSYKLGGLGFNGVGTQVADPLKANRYFWRDNSLIGTLFGYVGSAQIQTETLSGSLWTGNDHFWRVGLSLQQKYKDLTLAAGYMFGRNDRPYGNLSPEAVNSDAWFAEASYYVYPWLIPYVRYEGLVLGLPEDVPGLNPDQDTQRVTVGAKALVRQNISVSLETTFYTQGADLRSNLDKTLFVLFSAAF